jgi:glycosyltransferase involved in cell wall biosynthesis
LRRKSLPKLRIRGFGPSASCRLSYTTGKDFRFCLQSGAKLRFARPYFDTSAFRFCVAPVARRPSDRAPANRVAGIVDTKYSPATASDAASDVFEDHDMLVALALGGTDKGHSGIGIYVREVLPRLRDELAAGGDELLLLGTQADFDAYESSLGDERRVVVPHVFDAPGPSSLWHLVWAGARARFAGADVLLLPAANRRCPVVSPIPTVGVVHDLAQLHVREKYDPLRMLYVNRVLTRAFRSLSVMVAVSHATARDLAEVSHCELEEVIVVPNGVDADRFRPLEADDPAVTRARATVGVDGPYALYVSRFEHPGKNHLRLLQAFAQSDARKSHRLVLAGKDWGAEAAIREECHRLDITDRVVFAGFVSDELLPGLLAGADAVVMVGLREGFGLPALEGLATGRAIVASETGALPEVVGELGALCDPFDVGSISQALTRGLFDEELRERAKQEGPSWAGARGWDATARGLRDACRAALATA